MENRKRQRISDLIFNATHKESGRGASPQVQLSDIVRKVAAGATSVVLATSMLPVAAIAQENVQDDSVSSSAIVQQEGQSGNTTGGNGSQVSPASNGEESQGQSEIDQQTAADILDNIDIKRIDSDNSNKAILSFEIDEDYAGYSLKCNIAENTTSYGSDAVAAETVEGEGNENQIAYTLVEGKTQDSPNLSLDVSIVEVTIVRTSDGQELSVDSDGNALVLPESTTEGYLANEDAIMLIANDSANASGLTSTLTSSATSDNGTYYLGASGEATLTLSGDSLATLAADSEKGSQPVATFGSYGSVTLAQLKDAIDSTSSPNTCSLTISYSANAGVTAYTLDTSANTITVPGDCTVSLSQFTDSNNNAASTTGSVVFDGTSPTVSIVWDSEGSIFQKRTGTLTVVEENFDENKVTLPEGVEIQGSWSTSGNTHTVSIVAQGIKKYSSEVISVSDKAGNSGEAKVGSFTIDATSPQILVDAPMAGVNSSDGVYYLSKDNAQTIQIKLIEENFSNQTATVVTLTDADGNAVDGYGPYTVSDLLVSSSSDAAKVSINTSNLDDGKYTLSVSSDVKDAAGNALKAADGSAVAPGGTLSFVVDTEAPKITSVESAALYTNAYDGEKVLFHNATNVFVAKFSDTYLLSQNDTQWSLNDSSGTVSYSYGTPATSGSATLTLENGQTLTKSSTIVLTDMAGNKSYWSLDNDGSTYYGISYSGFSSGEVKTVSPDEIIVDTEKPEVSLSGVTAGAYYSSPATATVKVTEKNFSYLQRFNSGQTVLTVNKKEGNAGLAQSSWTVPVSSFSGSDSEYTFDQQFTEDGHYTLTAQVTDPAGWTSDVQTIGEFTVDRTAPEVSISWDNNNAKNGKYYASDRTATITVVEHNFDSSLVNISAQGGSVGSWQSNGDAHTITVYYGSDGECGLSVTATDLAGNSSSNSASDFVIDKTAPTISFSGVEDHGAYNDVVAPIISFMDATSFDANGTSWTLVGSKHGTVNFETSTSLMEGGSMVTFADFLRQISVDDVYTLTAYITDLAGNSYEQSITFSVNRFGSNFIVVNPTYEERVNPIDEDDPYDFGFLADAPEIVVREINVDPIDTSQSAVAVTHGVSTTNLDQVESVETAGYTVASSSNDYGWNECVYTVSRESFKSEDGTVADGDYSVEVSSVDAAGNTNTSAEYWSAEAIDEGSEESQKKSALVHFTLDSEDPEIIDASVSNAGLYLNWGEHDVAFTVSDNIGFDPADLQVSLNGEDVTSTLSDLGNGRYSFTVGQDVLDLRSLSITVSDYANRTKTYDASYVELLTPFVIGAAVVLIAVGAAGITVAVRRNRMLEEE